MIDYKKLMNKKYYEDHREELLEKQKSYNKCNKEKYNNYQRKYQKEYKKKYNQLMRYLLLHKSRCKKDNVIFNITYQDLEEIFNFFDNECAFCDNQNIGIGYIIPRKQKGGMIKGNIIPICPSCRSSKKSKMLNEWTNWKCLKYDKKIKITEYINIYKNNFKL